MTTRSLNQLVDAVQRTADVVAFTDRHPVVYIQDLVCRGIAALERQCLIINPEFKPIGSTTITTDGVATSYPLPSDFRSLLSVEYTDGNSHKQWLLPYEIHERSALTDPDMQSTATRANFYKLIGTNIEFLPRPPANDSAKLWYVTSVTQLSSGSQVVNVLDRLDDYIIWWAAREIANERENWERSDRLSAQLAGYVDELRIVARQIDLSHPARIVDQCFADRYGRYRWRGWR